MAKLFTTTPGAVIHVGNYGDASNEEPCIVPEVVADELASDPRFRIERDAPAPKKTPRTPPPAPADKKEE